MGQDTQPTNIPLLKQYIIRSVGYLKLPDNFKNQFGNIKKYKGEPKVAATISGDTLTISYTFKIDKQTNKIIENEE